MCASLAQARSKDLQLEAEEVDAPFITDELDRQDPPPDCSTSGAAQSARAVFPCACELQRSVLMSIEQMCTLEQRRHLSSLSLCFWYLPEVLCRLEGQAMPSWSVRSSVVLSGCTESSSWREGEAPWRQSVAELLQRQMHQGPSPV